MSEKILDEDDFMERVQGDTDLFFELLDIFINDFYPKRQSLKEAIANKDCLTVEHVSHFLKGSCGNISAGPLRAIFHELEVKGKNNDLQGIEGYLSEIDQKFEELMARIGELRTKLR
jgi:HPt (histidine-containing phosphotransfer) domain-containing protein